MNLLNKKVVSTVLFLTAFFVLQLRAMDYGHMLMNIDVEIENQNQRLQLQQLYKAIEDNNQKKIVSLIEEEGVDINKISFVVIEQYYEEEYITPLFFCIFKKNINALKLLIKYGANINKRARGGWTPLAIALSKKEYKIAEILIDNGGDVNLRTGSGRAPLHIICENFNSDDDISIVKKLLRNKANINAMAFPWNNNQNLLTPLMFAIGHGNKKIVALLLEEGAKVTLKNNIGQTALDLAREELLKYPSSHSFFNSIYSEVIRIVLNHHNIYITHQNKYKKFDQHFDFIFNYKSNLLF